MARSADERRGAFLRGREAEALVAARLEAQGWSVLARNWQANGAELDLVAARDGRLRFVEVKAREPDDDSALESITADKRRRLTRAAEAWLDLNGEPEREAAFTIAVVTMTPTGPWTIAWLDDAFDAVLPSPGRID